MAAQNITYNDKVTSQSSPKPAEEKFRSADANEIKNVVNNNATELDLKLTDAPADGNQYARKDNAWDIVGASSIKFEAWVFDVATSDADPGSGKFRFDNIDPTLATFIFISNDTAQGVDVEELLQDLQADSNIGIQQISNIAKAFLFNVTGAIVDGGLYQKIPVSFTSQGGGGLLEDTEIQAFSIIPVGSAIVGTDEPERIDFEDNLDTVYQTQYIMPLQVADVTSNGISAITYSAAPDDGSYDFAGNVENVNIAALNVYLNAQTNGTWHVVRTTVTLSRASSIRRVKNLA